MATLADGSITDYKNLECIHSAKRLNPCQALFFTRFLFTITYRSGDKKIKADSLSLIHSPNEAPAFEPILPPALISSMTVGPNSSHIFGRHSSNSCVSQLAFPLVITPKPTARVSWRYRRLGNTSRHTATPTSTAGAAFSHGPSMPRNPLNRPSPDSPPSSAYLVSSPLYSPGPKKPQMFQLWTTGSERAS